MNAMQRRYGAVQHVVNAVEVACLLNGADVGGLLHHADQLVIARGAGAVNAGINISDVVALRAQQQQDRKSTRLNSSHVEISYAVFCLKKKKKKKNKV